MIIKVGTDCSGIEAPIHALNNIVKKHNIKYKHGFACDIDNYVIQYHKNNHKCTKFFNDITKRDIKDVPAIDLYVAGFPCQPYSRANKYKNNSDKRKNIFYNCFEVIKNKKPKIFLLENVKTLLSNQKGETFKNIMKELEDLNLYNIHYKVLNTKDYSIPQCRDRLFIVGILKSKTKKEYKWPEPKKMKSLKSFIDKKAYPKEKIKESNTKLFNRVPKDAVFIDIGFTKANFPNSNKWVPCITAQANMWNFNKQRRATVDEYLMLQGFPIDKVNQTVSDHRFKKLIGNSMSVNVIELILINCFNSVGYI